MNWILQKRPWTALQRIFWRNSQIWMDLRSLLTRLYQPANGRCPVPVEPYPLRFSLVSLYHQCRWIRWPLLVLTERKAKVCMFYPFEIRKGVLMLCRNPHDIVFVTRTVDVCLTWDLPAAEHTDCRYVPRSACLSTDDSQPALFSPLIFPSQFPFSELREGFAFGTAYSV